jgi:divalent metal cation (Fe/Co/Zn/Cd) transporter
VKERNKTKQQKNKKKKKERLIEAAANNQAVTFSLAPVAVSAAAVFTQQFSVTDGSLKREDALSSFFLCCACLILSLFGFLLLRLDESFAFLILKRGFQK